MKLGNMLGFKLEMDHETGVRFDQLLYKSFNSFWAASQHDLNNLTLTLNTSTLGREGPAGAWLAFTNSNDKTLNDSQVPEHPHGMDNHSLHIYSPCHN